MLIVSQSVLPPKAHQTWAEPPEVHPGWTEPPPSPIVIPVPAEPVAEPPRTRPDIVIYSTIITMQIIQFLATLLLLMRT